MRDGKLNNVAPGLCRRERRRFTQLHGRRRVALIEIAGKKLPIAQNCAADFSEIGHILRLELGVQRVHLFSYKENRTLWNNNKRPDEGRPSLSSPEPPRTGRYQAPPPPPPTRVEPAPARR